jgi:TPP-dependent pyruvate/acetoin dehydrogenase alpha subunit
MPIAGCLANVDIYRKAEAFCMPGLRVDGNNVIEVYRAAGQAIESARRGDGPTLIECLTYRWLGHVGPSDDLDKGLRSREEVAHWMGRCPVAALEKALLERGIMSPAEKARLYENIDREVDEAVAFARESAYPDEGELLDNIFTG